MAKKASAKQAIALIAGLGNPGTEYAKTRHSAGFWFVDAIAERYGGQFRTESRFKAEVCRVNIDGRAVWLLKPTTFMNNSGPSVAACAAYYKLTTPEILVAHDELSLPSGEVQIRVGGGLGGHNGLRDISAHTGPDFARARIGIDRPPAGQDVAAYVLNAPRAHEQELIDAAMRRVVEQIESIVAG